LDVYSPISLDVLDELLPCLNLNENSTVVDIGCGNGRFLCEILKRTGCKGVAIDNDPQALVLTQTTAKSTKVSEQITLKASVQDLGDQKFGLFFFSFFFSKIHFSQYLFSIDLVINIGASGAFGNVCNAMNGCAELILELRILHFLFLNFFKKHNQFINLLLISLLLLQRNGFVLFGDVFWARKPMQSYLDAFFGGDPSDILDYSSFIDAPDQLTPAWVRESSTRDWDRYEGLYRLGIVRHIQTHPNDVDIDYLKSRSARWYRSYLYHRGTLGFLLALFASSKVDQH